MAIISQTTYTIKRIQKERYKITLTPETIAIPCDSLGVPLSLDTAKAKIRFTFDEKEIIPVYDDALDGMDGVPGRNLIRGAADINSGYWKGNGVIISQNDNIIKGVSNKHSYPRILNNTPNDMIFDTSKKYVLSFFIKADASRNASFAITNLNGQNSIFSDRVTPISDNWTFINRKFTPLNDGTININIGRPNNLQFFAGLELQLDDDYSWIEIHSVKLEKSETDNPIWTPAPEDILDPSTFDAHNCTVEKTAIDEISITGISVDADTAYVDIPIEYGDFKTTKRLTLAKSKQGATGLGISDVKNYYLATSAASGVTTATAGWTEEVQVPSSSKKYLWNYEKITYSDNSSITTTPTIIGNYAADGATGSAGKGIASITEYYQVNNSPTTAPSSWLTTVPSTSTTYRYLWNYEKITYTDNSIFESKKRVISVHGMTGSTGATGATGRGVSSITEQYYLSTSKTTQSGGSWSDTPPAWVEGKYMWRRQKITYSDSTVSYTAEYVESSWEAYAEIYDLAKSKNKIFYVRPQTADSYKIGDLWLKATYQSGIHKVDYVEETLVCKTDKAPGVNFSITHWEPAINMGDPRFEDFMNNLYVGANLVPNSLIARSSSLYGFAERLFNVEAGTTYTLTVSGRCKDVSSGKLLRVYVYYNNNNSSSFVEITSSVDDIKSVQFTPNSTGQARIFSYYFPNTEPREGVVVVNWYKVEVGERSTEWQPNTADEYQIMSAIEGSTDIDGGLIATNLIRMKDESANVTAGISGLSDNVGFWAGGSYQQALEGLVSILLKKDGAGHFAGGKIAWDSSKIMKIGMFVVDYLTGRTTVYAKDGETPILEIKDDKLPILNSLINTPVWSDSVIVMDQVYLPNVNPYKTWKTYFFEGTEIIAYYNNARIDVSFNHRLYASGPYSPWADDATSAYISLYTQNNNEWTLYRGIKHVSVLPQGYGNDTLVSVSESFYGCPSQKYCIGVEYKCNSGASYVRISNPKIDITANVDVKRAEIGEEGAFYFYKKQAKVNYFYINADSGIKIGGQTDIPAGLGGASISSGGVVSKAWGKVTANNKVNKSGNNYTIEHNIGDTDYSLILTPKSTNVPYFLDSNRQNNTVVVTCAGGFDFVLIRTK